jgi:hypothetical protein
MIAYSRLIESFVGLLNNVISSKEIFSFKSSKGLVC